MAQVSSSDFAARVRARFPGEYDKIPDDELTQRVIAKYPEYAPMVLPQGSNMPAAPQMQTSTLGKVYANANQTPTASPKAAGATAIGNNFQAGLDAADTPTVGSVLGESRKAPITAAGIGLGGFKGMLHTGATTANLLPGVNIPTQSLAPSNPSEKLGYTGEQIGEWALPTGAEEAMGNFAGRYLPQAGKFAPTLAAQTLESGARNVTQGGDFSTGAGAGLIGGLAAPVANKAAQGLAGIALAPGKTLLKSLPEGVNIGKVALEDSTGIRPESIYGQLKQKTGAAFDAKQGILSDARDAGMRLPLNEPRNLVSSEMNGPQGALQKNAPEYIKGVQSIGDQLNFQNDVTGKPVMAAAAPPTRQGAGFTPVQVTAQPKMNPMQIPASVDPVKFDAMRQGIDSTIQTWDPSKQSLIAPLQERVRGSMAGTLHSALPATAAPDAAMTRMIPTQDAAFNTAFNPSVGRRMFNRVAHTGSIASGLYGADKGYKEGGAEGALLGGIAGLTIPEALVSPEGQMIAARLLTNSGGAFNVGKGAALQFNRPSSLYNQQPTK